MAKVDDKPIDIADEKGREEKDEIQSSEQEKLAKRVQELFRTSYEAKSQLDLFNLWRKCDDYKHNRQNPKQNEEHPGSVTNIIHPIIESQIADLVDKPFSAEAHGWEPSDDMFAEQVRNMMEMVLYRNRFKTKLNVSEHDRLELGTTIIKVWFDEDDLEGRGLPKFEPISPANAFPDPKISAPHLVQEGEFFIHAVPRPLSWFRKTFPKWGKFVNREVSVPYNPEDTFEDAMADEVSTVTSQKALLLECYMRDENGEVYCVHVANHIVLEDSREVLKQKKNARGEAKKLQRRNKFPFVMIPCYIQRGTAWGQGDVEMLIPTQDLINELDDQIRMSARLAGNPQMVVGMGAGRGFDFRKWTNAPGLRIPMRDHNAFTPVPPQNVASDVPMRREKAFEEANIISGRPDVNRGEKPGQVTAAAAIMALQQAGQKGVMHKAEMFKSGWSEVLELLFDEIMDNWDEEMWIRIDGEKPDYSFVDPRKLREVPRLVPVLEPLEGEDTLKQLTDIEEIDDFKEMPVDPLDPESEIETMTVKRQIEKPMTRDAQFDFKLTMGNGMPNDTAFIYQTLADWVGKEIEGKPIITWQDIRNFLRDRIGITLESDEAIEKRMQQMMPPALPPGMAPPMGPPGMPPMPQGAPPLNLIQGGGM
ncbi:portal protein [Paenibacillus alkalitolerans]|uniref:portal protein n=1 Tax=Paenibacillus alkalitolerans TaxID=2799335 RepID=UPI0018F61CEC|nr:hypothetical protein [Paenibacillus alkalitolerans]